MIGGKRSIRSAWPVLLGFGLLVAMVLGSLWFAHAQSEAADEAARVFNYHAALTETLSAAKDAEIGQRGYVLTGEAGYLKPYESGKRRIGPALDEAQKHSADGAALVAKLRPLVKSKFGEMQRTIDLVRSGRAGTARALVDTDRGVELMDRIRAIIGAQRETSRAVIEQAQSRVARQSLGLTIGLLAGLAVLLATVILWWRAQRAQFVDMRLARDEAESSSMALREQMAAREAAESALRQMQKMESIGQLTGGIAHDFNNMLAIVLGNLDLAQRRLTSQPDRALASIAHAREGAERAATLTARLLAFSRQQPLAPEPVDANKLVASMSELLRRTLGEQVMVETVLAGGLWRTHLDVSQLENAIVNLAVNARDAMPEGGKLTIETANAHLDDSYADVRAEVVPGQYVLICITDTGTGMSSEVIERAFDPFFTTKPVGKGTGLGLSQVFGFVKQSGGHIAIYSESGEGTTIKLYLPRFFGAAEPAHTAAVDADTPLGSTDEIILVVEDEQRVRHFSVDALRELGYTAISASGAAEALALLDEQANVALLFTDVVMPEMDGRRLAEAALLKRPGLRILYTTGYTRNSVVHNGRLDAGVNFLAKPYSIAQLARKIRSVLDEG
jgi:signal transduction histidine kinase/CheY-like chemotaxis protein